MSQAAQKQSDATMNDIMASLKRIMNDDERGQMPNQPSVNAPLRGHAPLSNMPTIDLTEQVHAFEDVDTTRALDPRGSYHDLEFLPSTTPVRRAPELAQDTLLSASTHAAVTSAFSALSSAVAPPAPSKSIDAMVSEMLQPMLKKWLDDNLPPMVERLIRAEIERVARGGK